MAGTTSEGAPPRRVGSAGSESVRRGLAAAAAVLLLAGAGGCDDGAPSSRAGDAIPAETFVDAMAELRRAAQRTGGEHAPPEERDRILDERGITSDDLREFVEVHGHNVPFMNQVWAEVDRKLRRPASPGEEEAGPADPVAPRD